jgi:hypothetical protein
MANPKLELLTPQNCQLIFVDRQPQMAFGVQSIDRQMLKNNTVVLAKAAKVSRFLQRSRRSRLRVSPATQSERPKQSCRRGTMDRSVQRLWRPESLACSERRQRKSGATARWRNQRLREQPFCSRELPH